MLLYNNFFACFFDKKRQKGYRTQNKTSLVLRRGPRYFLQVLGKKSRDPLFLKFATIKDIKTDNLNLL